MSITVVISTWQVPYAQIVEDIVHFGGDAAGERALAYINLQSAKWWTAHEGDRSVETGRSATYGTPDSWGGEGYEPITSVLDTHPYTLWGGENIFHAMLDKASYWRLHEDHYKREYDDKGLVRPGYLINSYVAGHKPGGMTEAEREKYTQQQAEGMAAIEAKYGDHTKQ